MTDESKHADALQDLAYYNGAKQALIIASDAGIEAADAWLARLSETTQLPAVRELKAIRDGQ